MCMNFMCQDLAWGCVQWCFELAVHGDDVMVFSDGRRGLKVGSDEKASGSLPNQVGEVVGASKVAVAAAGNVPKQGGIAKN